MRRAVPWGGRGSGGPAPPPTLAHPLSGPSPAPPLVCCPWGAWPPIPLRFVLTRCAGVGMLVLRGPHVSRRLGRGGGSHSGSPLGRGGGHPPCLGGWGPGPLQLAGWWGGGGGGVAPRPPCSRSRRRPAVLLSSPLRVAGALLSGARVRSGLECRPGVGGGEGRPVDRFSGAPADLNPPSVTSEWAVVTGGSCGARPPSCSVVRVAPARQCGFAGAGPAPVALTASPFLLRGGAPPRPWGGGGPRLWLPS